MAVMTSRRGPVLRPRNQFELRVGEDQPLGRERRAARVKSPRRRLGVVDPIAPPKSRSLDADVDVVTDRGLRGRLNMGSRNASVIGDRAARLFR